MIVTVFSDRLKSVCVQYSVLVFLVFYYLANHPQNRYVLQVKIVTDLADRCGD